MCLIALAWNLDPERPLVVIANRDEFHDRPAAPLAVWENAPDLVAGRDLREHGTWLGVSRRGRMAAVTNVRDAAEVQRYPRSRGALTTDFLLGRSRAAEHARRLIGDSDQYGGFNLLLWDGRDLVYASNRPSCWSYVEPGVHGLSNAQLDTPWPKVRWARDQMDGWMKGPDSTSETLLTAMTLRQLADDTELPDTGVGEAMERVLAPPFIDRPGYGTRCTTWLQIGRHDARIRERRYDHQGRAAGDTEMALPISIG